MDSCEPLIVYQNEKSRILLSRCAAFEIFLLTGIIRGLREAKGARTEPDPDAGIG